MQWLFPGDITCYSVTKHKNRNWWLHITNDFCWYHHVLDWYMVRTKYNAHNSNNSSFYLRFDRLTLSCEKPAARLTSGRFVVRRFVDNFVLVWMGLPFKCKKIEYLKSGKIYYIKSDMFASLKSSYIMQTTLSKKNRLLLYLGTRNST